ncbi:MAG: flagellar biosynthesis protein FlhF [Gammaproteobacteria bacterium]
MKVRRYVAASMREALDVVRREQGSDALILSDRAVDGGIELMVATGEIDAAVLERLTPRSRTRAAPDVVDAPREPAAVAPAPADTRGEALWTHPRLVEEMQRELGAIRALITQQMSTFAWHDARGRSLHARLLAGLDRLGLAPHLAQPLVAALGDDAAAVPDFDMAWQQVLAHLRAGLHASPDPLRDGGVAAFCGATGVGKTTLISKIAARHALAHGVDAVAIVSADEQRLGAHHQIQTFGRLLGIRVEVARDRATLGACLRALAGTPLVLIDLPGHAPRDAQLGVTLDDLHAVDDQVALYYVAAATTDYHALRRALLALADAPLAGLCLSKLDEAAGFGAALSTLYETGLPLAYVSEGQQVPDDHLDLPLDGFIARADQLSVPQHVSAVPGARALSA